VSGKRRHKTACTTYKAVLTLHQASTGGAVSMSLPSKVHGHALPAGRYLVIVTPVGTSGQAGAPQTLKLVLRHHKKHHHKRHRRR
jgi:hypothetical protein